jgi:hypothetical protein
MLSVAANAILQPYEPSRAKRRRFDASAPRLPRADVAPGARRFCIWCARDVASATRVSKSSAFWRLTSQAAVRLCPSALSKLTAC